MSLRFAICAQCHESHAVRANGLMSIHQTASGERCAPPVPAPAPRRPVEAQPKRPPRRERAEAEWDRRARAAAPVDDELAAAFELAAERKKPSQRDQPAAFDRRIYAVGGAHVVRGGLPTLGRGRRNG